MPDTASDLGFSSYGGFWISFIRVVRSPARATTSPLGVRLGGGQPGAALPLGGGRAGRDPAGSDRAAQPLSGIADSPLGYPDFSMPRTREVVRVLEVDPDLAEALDSEGEALARAAAVARVDLLEPGEWNGNRDYPESAGHLGLLMLDGLMARTVEVGNRSCAELLGPGDILRPWVSVAVHSSVPLESHWTVVDPVRVAVLDRRFTNTMARYPEIVGTILDRVMIRSRWLSFHLAVCHLKRIETRLMVVFWHFADRWGRVTPRGVSVPIRVTHQLLAGVVGAQRPSVTTALGSLRRSGSLERLPDGTWLLHGDPPQELGHVHDAAGGRPFRDVGASLENGASSDD
jgi:CRP/FNR family transcriptional regulator, cyclic AMP receptor protein